jgi:hypothetical protein
MPQTQAFKLPDDVFSIFKKTTKDERSVPRASGDILAF